jgi:serine/threonine protein phosphatase PrpC
LPQALKRSYHQANEHFLKIAEKMKYHDGSCGITAIVRDTKVLVANVGDCRCLIISAGRPIQMSIDQKPTNPEEQKRIVALGGTVVYCMGVARVNRVLAVSRAFGNRTLRSVIRPDAEMMQRELTKDDDYIVMASDGLWDVLKNKDVCEVCGSPFLQGDPQAIADELVSTALLRGSMDNVTCLVVKLGDYVERMLQRRADIANGIIVPSQGSSPSQQQHPNPSGHPQSLARLSNFNADRRDSFLEKSKTMSSIPTVTADGAANGVAGMAQRNNDPAAAGLFSRQYSTGTMGPSAGSGRLDMAAMGSMRANFPSGSARLSGGVASGAEFGAVDVVGGTTSGANASSSVGQQSGGAASSPLDSGGSYFFSGRGGKLGSLGDLSPSANLNGNASPSPIGSIGNSRQLSGSGSGANKLDVDEDGQNAAAAAAAACIQQLGWSDWQRCGYEWARWKFVVYCLCDAASQYGSRGFIDHRQ